MFLGENDQFSLKTRESYTKSGDQKIYFHFL